MVKHTQTNRRQIADFSGLALKGLSLNINSPIRKCRKLLSRIIICSSFILKENHVFIEEVDNPADKVVIAEEELDGIDIDGIGN